MERIKHFYQRYKQYPLLYTICIIVSVFIPFIVIGCFIGHVATASPETLTKYHKNRKDVLVIFLIAQVLRLVGQVL